MLKNHQERATVIEILTVAFPEVSNPKNSDNTDTQALRKTDFLLQKSDIEFIDQWFRSNNSNLFVFRAICCNKLL